MRYITYTRVSTLKQDIQSQRESCLAYIEKHKKPNDTIIEFNEYQQSTILPLSRRKVLKQLLEIVRPGDTVVTYKIDRIARNPKDIISIYYSLIENKVNLIGICDPTLSNLTICTIALTACAEREGTIVRTTEALLNKKKRGERLGAVEYGYSLDMTCLQLKRENIPSYGKPYKLIVNPDEQKVIKLAIELYNQDLSYSEITKQINAAGYLTRKGTPFNKRFIWKLVDRQPEDSLEIAV